MGAKKKAPAAPPPTQELKRPRGRLSAVYLTAAQADRVQHILLLIAGGTRSIPFISRRDAAAAARQLSGGSSTPPNPGTKP
jgi:hypothetical protein